MKKHLLYIIIGAVIGTLPALLIVGWRYGGIDLELSAISLGAGGVPGSICGWIGGAIAKSNRGAFIGGLLGSIPWTLFITFYS